MSANIIDDGVNFFAFLLQKYGWPIIFSLIALYYALPHVKDYLRQVSLASANNRHRRSILEADMKRARVMQQLDLYKANREAR